MSILHLTNGDAAASQLAQAALEGKVLPWRDVLHDGPVAASADDTALAAERARFLAARFRGNEAEISQSFAERDAQLAALGADDELILWFEPDLYDQLQLAQVLERLHRRDAARRPHIDIVPADVLLGPLDAGEFPALHAGRLPIAEEDLAFGAQVWRQFTSDDHSTLANVVRDLHATDTPRSYALDPDARLPYMGAALHRLFEEYPWSRDGLSRTDRQILRTLADEPLSIAASYPKAHHAHEEWIWLGDSSYGWYVQRLSEGAKPLVELESGGRIDERQMHENARAFWDTRIRLTDFGEAVLRGEPDAIETNGIDRWIGGVHLHTGNDWRWFDETRQLERKHVRR